ncbi:MAG TPA: hypothetical protein DCP08_00625 [Chloroflexi bacterium]|nr:hypothetical protein [Chloroflexota bacterium]
MAITKHLTLAQLIEEETGNNIYLCYQCKKCTSGCPLSEHFDLEPHRIMRALQLGREELALSSATIWLCASCQTCTTRCPEGLDVARIMDRLKMAALERGIKPRVPEVALFNAAFLRTVRTFGRSYEPALVMEVNLRTGQPLKDLSMAWELVRKRKIGLLPPFVRLPRRVARRAKPEQIAYYPGCSLHSSAREFDISARALFQALEVELLEPRGWTCCGSSPAHTTDHLLATRLALDNLALMERHGFQEVMAPCASCFSRFKTALWDVGREPELRRQLDEERGYEFQGEVEVKHLLEVLAEQGVERIAEKVETPLRDLKVACYYGCLLTRPPQVTGAKDPEYPMVMEGLAEAAGASSLHWSYKTECCGAALSISKTSLALELSARILRDAEAVGADLVVVACPLCHANLDLRQGEMALGFRMPILYITQLLGLALGLRRLGLEKHIVDPRPLLQDRGVLTA